MQHAAIPSPILAASSAERRSRAPFTVLAYAGLAWFALVLVASATGTFASYAPLFFLAAGGPIALFVATYLVWPRFRDFVVAFVGDPWGITAFQILRVSGIAMAIEAYRGAVPTTFGLPAGWGDFLIGTTALFAAFAWSTGSRIGRLAFILWNALGLLDLTMALGLAILVGLAPGGPVTMASVRLYPLALIPAFGVPLAFILHFSGLAAASRSASRASIDPDPSRS